MWSLETLRRALRRRDVFAGVVASSSLVLLFGAGGLGLYAWVAQESLEEADRWMHASLEVVYDAFATSRISGAPAGAIDLLMRQGMAGRIHTGDVLRSWGEWPPAERVVLTLRGDDRRGLDAFRLLRRENYLLGRVALPGGAAELALPLDYYVSETAEVASIIALITTIVGVGAVILCVASIRLAFAPLRRATALVREVDARSLESRLPTRSTADPIDLHAEALNQVLEKIEEAFSRLRAFSADAAHELRTPVNRVHNIVEVALRGSEGEELRSALEKVEATTSELGNMVDSLLLLAEIDERRFQPRLAEFDPGEWVRNLADFYTPLFEEGGAKLTCHVAARSVVGDRALLDRVLVNLLENALDHTGVGDEVEIRAEDAGNAFRLSVDDSGPGIDARARERVFDRFVRVDPKGHKGSGLGLALARAIARFHGGDLVAEPSPLGGTRLVLDLPGPS